MNIWKTIVGLIVTSVLSANVFAQSITCEEQLNAAAAEFEAGRFYGIPGMLKSCIDKGFTTEQRQRAFLLLTQTYLLLQDPIAAEDSYLKVLKANPEYETNPDVDPIDVVYLSKKFTAAPIFSLYGRAGGNTSVARVINSLYAYDSPGVPSKDKYTLRPGFQIGAGVDWHVIDQFSISAELNLLSASYRRTRTDIFGRDVLVSTDQQSSLVVPLMVKYTHKTKSNIKPFGYAGYSIQLLLSDKLKVISENKDENPDSEVGNISTETYESPSRNYTAIRTSINQSFLVGGGAKLKSGLNYWFLDLRYALGLTNIINKDAVFQTEEIFRSGHVDDFLRLDNLSLSVGFVYPLYKPRHVKKVRTKGILRKIKKETDEG
jgi:hypothetical protein